MIVSEQFVSFSVSVNVVEEKENCPDTRVADFPPTTFFSLIDTVLWKVAHSTPQAKSQCRSARVFGLAGLKYSALLSALLYLYQPQGVAIVSVVR